MNFFIVTGTIVTDFKPLNNGACYEFILKEESNKSVNTFKFIIFPKQKPTIFCKNHFVAVTGIVRPMEYKGNINNHLYANRIEILDYQKSSIKLNNSNAFVNNKEITEEEPTEENNNNNGDNGKPTDDDLPF